MSIDPASSSDFSSGSTAKGSLSNDELLALVDQTRREVVGGGIGGVDDQIVQSIYAQAHRIASAAVDSSGRRRTIDERLDGLLTHPLWGWPLMLLILATVFFLTVIGANIPSAFLAGLLIEPGGLTGFFNEQFGAALSPSLGYSVYDLLNLALPAIGCPAWLQSLLVDGVFLCLGWVISVMLPPMAIFFPLFTLLEDFGYLPRVAFNLDPIFSRCGAHGKQALTMSMGFGCNAAGVIACRIIDSPREKVIAILTNNFMICNGRFPTVIAIATVMVAAKVASGPMVALVAAGTVISVVLLGVALMFVVSFVLSRTVLKGEPSAFTLELPPYRRPSLLRILYTSMIDRTLFVLGRACATAAPAGLVIWLVSHVPIAGQPVGVYLIHWLEPLGWAMGLSGVILLAYVIAIPANEIVMPTILMLLILVSGTHGLEVQTGRMVELDGSNLSAMLSANGWSLLTSVCLLLFVVMHNPCGTTIWTIWKETRSVRWTLMATLMPVLMGVGCCMLVAAIWRWAVSGL